jgi:hypothetical protein
MPSREVDQLLEVCASATWAQRRPAPTGPHVPNASPTATAGSAICRRAVRHLPATFRHRNVFRRPGRHRLLSRNRDRLRNRRDGAQIPRAAAAVAVRLFDLPRELNVSGILTCCPPTRRSRRSTRTPKRCGRPRAGPPLRSRHRPGPRRAHRDRRIRLAASRCRRHRTRPHLDPQGSRGPHRRGNR